jgi:hypothetical protein
MNRAVAREVRGGVPFAQFKKRVRFRFPTAVFGFNKYLDLRSLM